MAVILAIIPIGIVIGLIAKAAKHIPKPRDSFKVWRTKMKNIEAEKIIEGIEEVHGTLPEDGLLVEEALRMAVEALREREPKAHESKPDIDITDAVSGDNLKDIVGALKELLIQCLKTQRNVAEVEWEYDNGMAVTAKVSFEIKMGERCAE